jgi:hypothetical protein
MTSFWQRTAAAFAGAAALAAATAPSAAAEPAIAVTQAGSPSLVKFDTATPGQVTTTPITGLVSTSERIVGIDLRPATGQVFAYSSAGRLYTLDPNSAVATRLAPNPAFGSGAFGFDFNPTVDRIRAVTDADQNARINPDTRGVILDQPLAYAAGDRNEGANPNVTAAAYTNNFAGAGATVLYVLDSTLDVLATQAPPNDGKLNTIGSLGVPFQAFNGFDISPRTGVAFAALSNGLSARFYRVDLGTGRATDLGLIGDGSLRVAGLTILPAS